MNASGRCLPHKQTSNDTQSHFTVHFTSNAIHTHVRDTIYRDRVDYTQATLTRPSNSLRDRTLGFSRHRAGWKICGGTRTLKDAKGAGQMRQDSGEKRRLHTVTFENCVFTAPFLIFSRHRLYIQASKVKTCVHIIRVKTF